MEINKIYHGDCLELMKDISDGSIDMILCDLPYGVTSNKKDITLPFDTLWQHYERIIKDTGVIALFAQGLFYVDLVQSNRKMFKYDLVWDKKLTSGFLNAKRMPLRVHEQIAIFYKKLGTYNPQFTNGLPSHNQGKKFLQKDVNNKNYGKFEPSVTDTETTKKYPKSIISFQKPHSSVALHRTEKSIDCLEWLIRTYSNEGETILDNTSGSGTTAIAAINTNRNYICMELDTHYYDLSVDRINNHNISKSNEFFQF
jgi:site-specific DNA-methyltransferase (adenine-specific)